MARILQASYLSATLVALTFLTYLILLGDRQTVILLAGKEMLLERIGAVLFLVAAVACTVAWVLRLRRRVQGLLAKHSYLLLAIFFIVACGEEISWGQNLFGSSTGFSTPRVLYQLNRQREVNIHNLLFFDSHDAAGHKKTGVAALLTANRLFDYFMFAAFLLLPAINRYLEPARAWLSRARMPIPPGSLTLPLIVNVVLTGIAEILLVRGRLIHLAVSEIREFNYALLCLAGVLYLAAREARRPSSFPEPSPSARGTSQP